MSSVYHELTTPTRLTPSPENSSKATPSIATIGAETTSVPSSTAMMTAKTAFVSIAGLSKLERNQNMVEESKVTILHLEKTHRF